MEKRQSTSYNIPKKYIKRGAIGALSLLAIFKGPACYQERKDLHNIKNGRLEYTEKGGRIDRGHADPGGARNLRNRMKNPKDTLSDPDYGFVHYGQHQRIKGRKFGVDKQYIRKFGIDKQYLICKDMTEQEKLSVALAILLEVSEEFEEYQSSTDRGTGSSYNEADIFSNVLGFYIASGQYSKNEIRDILIPVGVDSSLALYNQRKIGKNRIKETIIQQDTDGDISVDPYPSPFNIQPAEKGLLFKDYK